MFGEIISINISKKKGTGKISAGRNASIELKENFGIVGDAHAGSERQVSFLGWENVQKWLKQKSINNSRLTTYDIKPGDFAENITTYGIDWSKVEIGDKIEICENQKSKTILEVTQVGKKCHSSCNIQKLVGDCLMPKEGIFAKVIKGGKIKAGDQIKIVKCQRESFN